MGQRPYLHKRLDREAAARDVAASLPAAPTAWRATKAQALNTGAGRGPVGSPFGGYLSSAGYSSPQAGLRFQHQGARVTKTQHGKRPNRAAVPLIQQKQYRPQNSSLPRHPGRTSCSEQRNTMSVAGKGKQIHGLSGATTFAGSAKTPKDFRFSSPKSKYKTTVTTAIQQPRDPETCKSN